MIIKPYEQPNTPLDHLGKAGAKAEQQLAFYLKRKFGPAKNVYVLNGLRFEDDGDVAQIDHLILHRHGFILIESKSVTTKVKIDDQKHWSRYYDGQWSGMKSPVLQARLQADFLKMILNKNKEQLREKVMFSKNCYNFNITSFECLVAISDSGIIQGTDECVFKADQIPDEAERIIKQHSKAASVFNLSLKDLGDSFKAGEIERLCDFLLRANKPAEPVAKPAIPATPAMPKADEPKVDNAKIQPTRNTCSKCGSGEVEICYGPYGYYFKCGACNQNTKIVLTCSQCKGDARVRKDKQSFYQECKKCGTSELFHVNAENATNMSKT